MKVWELIENLRDFEMEAEAIDPTGKPINAVYENDDDEIIVCYEEGEL